MRLPSHYHKIDGWRGYWIPGRAVAGASDTGMWSDSPARSDEVAAEIRRFQREALRPAGIKSRVRFGTTSNVFAGKRWVTVAPEDLERAREITAEWLGANRYTSTGTRCPIAACARPTDPARPCPFHRAGSHERVIPTCLDKGDQPP